jgi:hypothetical protein
MSIRYISHDVPSVKQRKRRCNGKYRVLIGSGGALKGGTYVSSMHGNNVDRGGR